MTYRVKNTSTGEIEPKAFASLTEIRDASRGRAGVTIVDQYGRNVRKPAVKFRKIHPETSVAAIPKIKKIFNVD